MIVAKPEDIHIRVTGGPGKHSAFIPTFSMKAAGRVKSPSSCPVCVLLALSVRDAARESREVLSAFYSRSSRARADALAGA